MDMKQIKNILKYAVVSIAAAAFLTGCNQDELSTDQLDNTKLTFSAFAPNPVYRGGELTIIGTRLSTVASVEIPGVDAITEFTVEEGDRMDKLVLTVPVDGPEEGVITVVGKDGVRLESTAVLTYTEPIVFSSFSPAEAMPGDVITLKGDYLNLVKEVIFESGEYVTEFEEQSRYELKVTVPAHAVTGRLIIGDADEVADPDNIANKVYSESELAVGDPTVSSLTVKTAKPGEVATIKGAYLQMIQKVVFEGGAEVSDIVLNDDNTLLSVEIPAEAQSGTVTAYSYASKAFEAGKVEMIMPTGLSVSPEAVKAGEVLTIKGSDLDVVATVSLPGAGETSFSYADGVITLTVPAKATEGEITLSMANSDKVSVEYALVHPTVTAVSPVELTAGEKITVSGTDLDLVTGVTLGGKDESFEIVDGDVVITTSATSVSGKIVLSLANGETVAPEAEIALSYDSIIIVNEMPTEEHIGATVTLKGENFMRVEAIYIGDAKVTSYLIRNDKEVSFIMPYNKVGTYSLKFVLYDGSEEICPQEIGVLLEINYITAWEGNVSITWGDGGRVLIPASKFSGVKAGARMRLYYTQVDTTWAQAQVNYGDWSGIDFNAEGDGAVTFNTSLVPTNIYGWFSDGILDRATEVILTQEILDNIQSLKKDCEDVADCGIIIQGSDLTFTKVEILQEIAQEKTIWEGEFNIGSWGGHLDLAWGGYDWSSVATGTMLNIYVYPNDPTSDWWCVSLRHGTSWGALAGVPGQYDNPNGCLSIELTDEILQDLIDNGGLVITGYEATVKQITLL